MSGSKWTKEIVLKLFLEAENPADFWKKHRSAYNAALNAGFWKEILKTVREQKPLKSTKGIERKKKINTTIEDAKVIASKYQYRGEFSEKEPQTYNVCYRRGWLDDVCSHMIPKPDFWGKEMILQTAKKYKTYTECQRAEPGLFNAAKRLGIWEGLFEKPPNLHKIISIEEVKNRIKEVHGDQVKIIEESYTKSRGSARFVDIDHGEWETMVKCVLKGGSHPNRYQEKYRATSLEKYGVEHPHQNRDISLKGARSSNLRHLRNHWKTGEELVCQASWESKVVDYLNFNKIDFLWQPETFKMPNGKTYRPDLFLINENKWVEIKGWMRPESQIKWDWFLTQYPNSELWNEKKLKEMKILK